MTKYKKLKDLEKIIESGSPFQHSAANQMAKILRKEAVHRDRNEYEPEKTKPRKGQIRQGTYFFQTKNGKFVYACIEGEARLIALPIGTIPLSELSKITTEVIKGYRPAKPEDYDFLYIHGQGKVKSTPESFARWRKSLVLVSEKPIRSDVSSNWGREEIYISKEFYTTYGMEVITPSGEYISYCIAPPSIILMPGGDVGWNVDPKKNKKFFRYNKGPYAPVKNKEERERLIPQFWQIIKKIIGDDKIMAISGKPERMLPLTLEEARRQYEVRPVVSRKYMDFKNGKPQLWDCPDLDEGFPIYYFPMGKDEVGLLTDRSNSRYIVHYLFSKTKWYKKGIRINELEQTGL